MSTTIKVDCPNKKITLTWHVWFTSAFEDADIQTIKDVVADKWNNPAKPLKYGDCILTVEFDIHREKMMPKGPEKYDEWHVKAGGTTGAVDPSKSNYTTVDRDKDGSLVPGLDKRKISHELGHCFGILDPAKGDQKGSDWDKKGIKTEHVAEIIDAFAKANKGKWPAGSDPKCCNPPPKRKRGKIVIVDVPH